MATKEKRGFDKKPRWYLKEDMLSKLEIPRCEPTRPPTPPLEVKNVGATGSTEKQDEGTCAISTGKKRKKVDKEDVVSTSKKKKAVVSRACQAAIDKLKSQGNENPT